MSPSGDSPRRPEPAFGTRNALGIMEETGHLAAAHRTSPTKVQHVAEIDKEAFAAAVVHDMRAPLNACLMALSLIELKASQPAEVLKSVEVLRRNLERQAVLIDDLGDALQIVGGGLQLEPESADLVEIADRAALKVARGSAVAVAWAEGRPQPHPLRADPERLARAIGALIETIASGAPPGERIELAAGEASGRVRLDVRRGGRDERAGAAAAPKRPVMRLTVATEIVTAHGGRVELDDARARIELPRG